MSHQSPRPDNENVSSLGQQVTALEAEVQALRGVNAENRLLRSEISELASQNQSLLQEVESLRKKLNARLPVEPVFDDLEEFIKGEQVRLSTMHSTGRTGDSGRFALVSKKQQGEKCVRCSSHNHKLSKCIKAWEGNVVGCPLCNLESHLVDNCDKFEQMSLKEKVDVVVVSRGNMAPLRTKSPWYFHLWNYLGSEESEGIPLPTVFPWSEEFARDLSWDRRGKTIRSIQKKYDATGDEGLLPVDPATSSLEAIYKTFPGLRDLPWPERLNGEFIGT
ncbi:hypothetical protein NW762_011189 [Fusarium torreyae]|uniref:Uncharacterized protein n=1 Tax=Fusarium torreyae TaxID=1237075 RepID=A0A9W8RTN3_9HYPO|nr:hypothetical protein NW762_011189 [Fusarium torreyae]